MKQYKINDIVTVEEILLATCELREKYFEQDLEDARWSFTHKPNYKDYILRNFRNNNNIFRMVEQRDGNYVVKGLMRKPMEEFINEMADIEARKQEAITSREYDLPTLVLLSLKLQGMNIDMENMENNLRNLSYIYDIIKMPNGKYKLEKK